MTDKELQQRIETVLKACKQAQEQKEKVEPLWVIYMLTNPPPRV